MICIMIVMMSKYRGMKKTLKIQSVITMPVRIFSQEQHQRHLLQKKSRQKQPTKCSLIDDSPFVASLVRTKTSSRQAMHIVSPALRVYVGVGIESMSLSSSTIHRVRRVARKTLIETVRPQFVPNTPVIVQIAMADWTI